MDSNEAVDKAIVEAGWGPTLRLSTLVLVRGLARRISTGAHGRGRNTVAGVATSLVGATAGAYAKARGWI